jgi:hypothetical protein
VWGRRGAFTGQYAGSEFIPRYTLDPTSAPTEMAQDAAMPAQAPDDHHAPEDIGGRLDVTKGWTLNIPAPNESSGSLARALASQGQTAAAAPAPVVALNNSPKDALQ